MLSRDDSSTLPAGSANARLPRDLLQALVCRGLVSESARMMPLQGGISSDIAVVEDGSRRLVVKRALAQLCVPDPWHADVNRTRYERAYLERVGRFLPDRVPAVLAQGGDDEGSPWFAMSYIAPPVEPWKAMLLRGDVNALHGRTAGAVLGRIHRMTWNDAELAAAFDTTTGFHALRIEPYLLATAARHPDLAEPIHAEARRLTQARRCLVHGDFSPKNLLVHPEEPCDATMDQARLIVVDCEVAWYGNPAFDVAFLLNHLLIKALHVPAARRGMIELTRAAWNAYRDELGEARLGHVPEDVGRLLPMLMLARVDGKSPLEYLTHWQREQIRQFARFRILAAAPVSVELLIDIWESSLG